MCSSCVWNGKVHEKSIYPASIDDPKNTNFLKFEWPFIFHMFKWQCLWICNLHCSHSLQRQVIHLVLGEGCLQRVHQEFPTCTTSKVQLQRRGCLSVECLFWSRYEHESTLNKYPDRSTKGFYNQMYHNKTSVGNLLGQVKHQLDQLHCVLYTQKKNTRPNIATDK